MPRQKQLPYYCYFLPTIFITLIGLSSSTYLAIVHYRNYTDSYFSSICAISKAVNCDTVAQSTYSILFSLPLAIWGIFSFLFLLQLILQTSPQKQMMHWWGALLFGACACIISVYYGYIAANKIHSYCIFCLICYCSYFAITFYAFVIIRRFNISFPRFNNSSTYPDIRTNGIICGLFACMIMLTYWQLPQYWRYTTDPIDPNITTGKTATGAPWIGARAPQITVEEYSDYMCFQCGKMHFFLRNLVNKYPEKIRLVHHHFPMDHQVNPIVTKPFHSGAGQMAMLAIFANNNNFFWEMNDELYRLVRQGNLEQIDLNQLAKRLKTDSQELAGSLSNTNNLGILHKDIMKGLKLGITSTPSYLIDGKLYQGTIPKEIFLQSGLH